MRYETLAPVSPMSRREFLTTTASVVGGGLAAACVSDHRPATGHQIVGVNDPATVHGAVLSGRYAAAEDVAAARSLVLPIAHFVGRGP
jgi:hypothetical protein